MKPEEKAAREILENIFATFKPTHEFVQVEESGFRHLDLGFYRETMRALEKAGFRHVSDVEDVSIIGATSKMFKRIMIRSLISSDGTIMAGIYHPKPKFWVGILLWVLRSLPGKIVDFETELSDSSFIVTSNAESAGLLTSPPLIHAEYLKKDTPIETLLKRHQERIARFVKSDPKVYTKKAFTFAEIVSSQNRMNAIKAAFRGELKGISKSELDRFKGPQRMKDEIFEEIKKARDNNQIG